jgi:hypothetical protein
MLPGYEERPGPTHPETLGARSNHAIAVGATGEPDAARALYAELIPLAASVLGPDHPAVLDNRSNCALLAAASGNHAAAPSASTDSDDDQDESGRQRTRQDGACKHQSGAQIPVQP